MKNIFGLIMAAALCAGLGNTLMGQTNTDAQAAQRMGRYNVVWTSPSKDCTGVMPIGNGDIAAGIYAIEDDDLYLLLSKNDAFNSVGDLYKTGRVKISLTPNPFAAGKPFRQTLDLPTASIRIEADGVKLRIWADAKRPVYHVEIDSPHELSVTAQPELWKRYTGWGGPEEGPPDVKLDRGNKILWYHAVGTRTFYRQEMKLYCNIEDLSTVAPDPYRFNTFGNLLESTKLSVSNGVLSGQGRQFDLRIHALTMKAPDVNEWVQSIEQAASRPMNLQEDWERHCEWWKSFWNRGWIIASDRTVPPEVREKFNGEANAKGKRDELDGAALVAQSYNFFRFAMGAQSRGRFQTLFNGGLFTQQMKSDPSRHATEEGAAREAQEMKKFKPSFVRLADGSYLSDMDYRPWGTRYTHQNERLMYWPLLMSGDFDLMKPFFDHYWNVLEMRKLLTKSHFGHDGAFYRENVSPLSGSCGGLPPKTKPGENYKGDYHSYYFTSGLETVAMMADYVNFTGDTKFRDERLVPFAREILLFFDKHYLRGPDGKLRIDPGQALETWWITVNSSPDVAGLRFCLDQLLTMKAGTPEDQANWKRFRAEMPEVPMQMIEGRQAIAPAEKWEKKSNGENAEIYPVFPFRCYGLALGTADIVEWTMRHRYSPNTFGGVCWTQDQIGWAYAGNVQEAAKGLVHRFRAAQERVRFPLTGHAATDGLPDWDHFGSGSIALQRMLAQEGNGKIYLLPAWPAEWDVDFKLHLQGGAILTGTVKDGKLVTWDVTPAARKADVVVCAPTSLQAIAVTSNKQAKSGSVSSPIHNK